MLHCLGQVLHTMTAVVPFPAVNLVACNLFVADAVIGAVHGDAAAVQRCRSGNQLKYRTRLIWVGDDLVPPLTVLFIQQPLLEFFLGQTAVKGAQAQIICQQILLRNIGQL